MKSSLTKMYFFQLLICGYCIIPIGISSPFINHSSCLSHHLTPTSFSRVQFFPILFVKQCVFFLNLVCLFAVVCNSCDFHVYIPFCCIRFGCNLSIDPVYVIVYTQLASVPAYLYLTVNKLNCWWLPPQTVLFAPLLIIEMFSIRLSEAKENRMSYLRSWKKTTGSTP